MSGVEGRSGTLLRRVAFWLAAMLLLSTGLFGLERLIEHELDGSLTGNVVSMAESYVGHAETSLDYGLPINGPGSVEEVLQPPLSVAFGPDALTVAFDRFGPFARGADVGAVRKEARREGGRVLIVEQPVYDSHGEASSRLLLSRSTEGIAHAASTRQNWLVAGLAAFGFAFALLLAFLPPRRVARLPVIAFLPAALLLLAAFGAQSVGISRQAAVLATAETAAALDRAEGLGIRFGELVGMQDYLGRQIGSNPAINWLTVRGADGTQFEAGIESLGSAVGTLLSAAPFSALVDLNISQELPNGTRIEAFVNVQPILAGLGELATMALLYWVCGAALLRGLAGGGEAEAPPASLLAALPPSMLFLVLFAPAGLLGPSALASGPQLMLLAAGLTLGLLLPRRAVNPALGVAACGLVAGPWFEAAIAYFSAGLFVGVVLTGLVRSIRTLHLLVALLPSVGLLGMDFLDFGGTRLALLSAIPVLAIASVMFFVAFGKPLRRRADRLPSPVGLLGISWAWVCLGLIQASVFLLVVIAARQQERELQAGPMSYVLLAFVLHLVAYRLAGAVALGVRGRWVLLELSLVVAVLFIAGAYVAGWNLLFSTALAAALSGAAARWSADLPFVAPTVRAAEAALTCVRLIALVAATGLGLTLNAPEGAALPAAIVCLIALAPLAYAMLANFDPDWRPRRGAEPSHAA